MSTNGTVDARGRRPRGGEETEGVLPGVTAVTGTLYSRRPRTTLESEMSWSRIFCVRSRVLCLALSCLSSFILKDLSSCVATYFTLPPFNLSRLAVTALLSPVCVPLLCI